jgi:hypothetical protein
MFGRFRRLARHVLKLVFGGHDALGLDRGRSGGGGRGGRPRNPRRDPYARMPVRPRHGPAGRSGGVAVAEPDEELLVMAVARPRSHR